MNESKTVSHSYELQLIPARMFTVNRNYQRNAKRKEITDIINNFDYHLVNPVKAVKRDDAYYVWDGQQTFIALYTKFGPEYMVPTFVYTDIADSKTEARLLVDGNTNTGAGTKLTPNEVWDAILWADDPTALRINEIANAHGFNLGSGKKRKEQSIQAVDAVQKMYKILTEKQFEALFRIIRGALDGDPDSVTKPIIRGMAKFIKVYDGKFDEKNLIRRLSKKSPKEIIRNGRASFSKGDTKWAREIFEIYNNGTSTNRLPDLFGE